MFDLSTEGKQELLSQYTRFLIILQVAIHCSTSSPKEPPWALPL